MQIEDFIYDDVNQCFVYKYGGIAISRISLFSKNVGQIDEELPVDIGPDLIIDMRKFLLNFYGDHIANVT